MLAKHVFFNLSQFLEKRRLKIIDLTIYLDIHQYMIYFERFQVSPCSRIHLKKLVYLKLQFVQRKNFPMREEDHFGVPRNQDVTTRKLPHGDAGSFISFFRKRARRQCLLENRSKKSDMSIDFLKSAAMKQTPFLFLGM